MWFKYLVGVAVIGIAIALGVQKIQEKGTSQGPTVVTVNVPNPVAGGNTTDGGGAIYVP